MKDKKIKGRFIHQEEQLDILQLKDHTIVDDDDSVPFIRSYWFTTAKVHDTKLIFQRLE